MAINCTSKGSGGLDTTFGVNGVFVLVNATGVAGNDYAMAAAASRGKVVIAGFGAGSNANNDILAARLTSAGVLDTTFGASGTGLISADGAAGISSTDSASAAAIDSLGNLIVVGYSYNGTNFDMVVYRFTSAGAADATFGSGGVFTHNSAAGGNGNDYGMAVAIDTFGRIVVAGLSDNALHNSDMAIWRLNANGTLDTTFNGKGYTTHASAAGEI